MNADLEFLARNVSEWTYDDSDLIRRDGKQGVVWASSDNRNFPKARYFTPSEWLQARKDLGLIMSDEEEEMPAEEHRNKYMREIKPGVWVDVYDVLNAWAVQNPALQHLIKKALQPGGRGHKTMEQDMNDIVVSALRARELEK